MRVRLQCLVLLVVLTAAPLHTHAENADLCEPDPMESVCQELPPRLLRRLETRHEQMRRLIEDYDAADVGDVTDLGVLVSRLRPRVEERVHTAVKIFTSTLRQARFLSHLEQNVLIRAIRACTTNVEVWHTTEMNALSSPPSSAEDLLEVDESVCNIGLSPKYFIECAAGTVACYRVLFHEMAHFINTCRFLQMASALERAAEHQGWTEEVEQVHQTLMQLAEKMRLSTACLEQTGEPHAGLVNMCRFTSHVGDLEVRYCEQTDRTRTAHPSQWEEAEADLWAAVNLAHWFNQAHIPMADRQAGVRATMQKVCIESGFTEMDVDEEEEDEEAPSWAPEQQLARLWGALRQVMGNTPNNEETVEVPILLPTRAVVQHSALRWLETKVLRCRALGPEVPAHWSWEGHQDWETRWNRTFLRTPELRQALGCAVSEDLPVCSPLEEKDATR